MCMFEKYYAQVERINDAEIKEFVKTVLNYAPKRFWIDPCSSSGQWHPLKTMGVA